MNMNHTKRTEITLETHEVTVIRFRQTRQLFCELCRETVPHVALARVLAAHLYSEAEIARLTDNGRLHSIRRADGTLFLCSRSLAVLEAAAEE